MENLQLYYKKNGRLVGRQGEIRNGTVLISQLYDWVNKVNEDKGCPHFVFPKGIKPADYPEILKMEAIISHKDSKGRSTVQHYRNDFYLHDISAYFKSERKGLWLLRDTGTDYIPLNTTFNEEFIKVCEYYLKLNRYVYLIDNGNIRRISKNRATTICKSLLEKEKVA